MAGQSAGARIRRRQRARRRGGTERPPWTPAPPRAPSTHEATKRSRPTRHVDTPSSVRPPQVPPGSGRVTPPPGPFSRPSAPGHAPSQAFAPDSLFLRCRHPRCRALGIQLDAPQTQTCTSPGVGLVTSDGENRSGIGHHRAAHGGPAGAPGRKKPRQGLGADLVVVPGRTVRRTGFPPGNQHCAAPPHPASHRRCDQRPPRPVASARRHATLCVPQPAVDWSRRTRVGLHLPRTGITARRNG